MYGKIKLKYFLKTKNSEENKEDRRWYHLSQGHSHYLAVHLTLYPNDFYNRKHKSIPSCIPVFVKSFCIYIQIFLQIQYFIPFSFRFLNFLLLGLQTAFASNQLFLFLQILDIVPTVFAPVPACGETGVHSHELFLQNIIMYFMCKH